MFRPLPAALPIERIAAGAVIARIHRLTTSEPFFGPRPGGPPTHRFHDPRREFRMCFLGENASASFVETFLRNPPVRIITRNELANHGVTTFRVLRDLRVVKLYDDGLARIGCTAEVTSSAAPYDEPQQLSREVWAHRDEPDGIQYRCRHDNGLLAIALYDKAATALETVSSDNLVSDHVRLLTWRARYGFEIA